MKSRKNKVIKRDFTKDDQESKKNKRGPIPSPPKKKDTMSESDRQKLLRISEMMK
jgi:hypothetical protein